jgi:hypothetical protein
MLPRWLYASTPGAVAPISVRLTDATPMGAGTVLARASGDDPYVRHDPLAHGALGVARAVLLWPLPGKVGVHETIAITGGATLIGRLLNDGAGIDRMTHRDLEQSSLKVLA